MPLQRPAYTTDWVISNTSNVHVAKHQDWFFNYTPFATKTTHIALPGNGPEAIGVGDVHLDINTPSQERGKQAYVTLVLRDVLHCPSALTNIVAFGAMDGYDMKLAGPNDSWLKHEKSGVVYLLDSVVLWKLWLVGQPKGLSSLEKGGLYYINAQWSSEERERFKAYKEELKRRGTAGAGASGGGGGGDARVRHAGSALARRLADEQAARKTDQYRGGGGGEGIRPGAAEYTAEEKKWIEEHYGGEFEFLVVHGLKMHSEEDREEGRQIARAFMSDDE